MPIMQSRTKIYVFGSEVIVVTKVDLPGYQPSYLFQQVFLLAWDYSDFVENVLAPSIVTTGRSSHGYNPRCPVIRWGDRIFPNEYRDCLVMDFLIVMSNTGSARMTYYPNASNSSNSLINITLEMQSVPTFSDLESGEAQRVIRNLFNDMRVHIWPGRNASYLCQNP